MRLVTLAILLGWLVISYYVLNWAFCLSMLAIILYLLFRVYRLVQRWMTPPGHRIKHGLLRGHLEQEYGTKEGGKLYKELVGELHRKGYR